MSRYAYRPWIDRPVVSETATVRFSATSIMYVAGARHVASSVLAVLGDRMAGDAGKSAGGFRNLNYCNFVENKSREDSFVGL